MAGPKGEQKGTTHEGEDVSLEAHRERHREKEVVAERRGEERRETRTDTTEAEKGEARVV